MTIVMIALAVYATAWFLLAVTGQSRRTTLTATVGLVTSPAPTHGIEDVHQAA